MDCTDGQWIRKEIKMLPSAREMYEKNQENSINSLIDDYLNDHPLISKEGVFEIILTPELCKILCGLTIEEWKNYQGDRERIKSLILGNMHFWANQNDMHAVDEYFYEIKYLIRMDSDHPLRLLISPQKRY